MSTGIAARAFAKMLREHPVTDMHRAECRYADNAGRTCKTCKFDESTECTGYIFADIADRIRTLKGKEQ